MQEVEVAVREEERLVLQVWEPLLCTEDGSQPHPTHPTEILAMMNLHFKSWISFLISSDCWW
jgi:hypothetical protein